MSADDRLMCIIEISTVIERRGIPVWAEMDLAAWLLQPQHWGEA